MHNEPISWQQAAIYWITELVGCRGSDLLSEPTDPDQAKRVDKQNHATAS